MSRSPSSAVLISTNVVNTTTGSERCRYGRLLSPVEDGLNHGSNVAQRSEHLQPATGLPKRLGPQVSLNSIRVDSVRSVAGFEVEGMLRVESVDQLLNLGLGQAGARANFANGRSNRSVHHESGDERKVRLCGICPCHRGPQSHSACAASTPSPSRWVLHVMSGRVDFNLKNAP